MFKFLQRKNLRGSEGLERRSFHNPYFPREPKIRSGVTDRWTYAGIGALLTLGAVYLLLIADFFALSSVTIQGNQIISNDEIQKQVNTVLDQKILGIFKRRNFWLFNAKVANAQIRDAIQSEIALAEIQTKKKFPRSIVIQVEERIPSLIFTSKNQSYSIDLDGFISQNIALADANEHFPRIFDQNERTVKIGEQVMHPDLISWLFEIRQIIPEQTPFHIESFEFPGVKCSEKVVTSRKKSQKEIEDEQEVRVQENELRLIQERLQEGEISVTESIEFLQRLSDEPTSDSLDSQPDQNADESETAIIEYKTEKKPASCDYLNVIDELHVKTSEGPRLYLDHGQSLNRQIHNLRAVLKEKIQDPKVVQYIDLRFQDRVYYH